MIPEEKDIKESAMALLDYFRDLLILSGQDILWDKKYIQVRDSFGNRVVQLNNEIDIRNKIRIINV